MRQNNKVDISRQYPLQLSTEVTTLRRYTNLFIIIIINQIIMCIPSLPLLPTSETYTIYLANNVVCY